MKRKIALLSNITISILEQKLRKKYEVYLPAGYDTWISEVLNKDSGYHQFSADLVFFFFDCKEARRNWETVETGIEQLEVWLHTMEKAMENSEESTFFISNLDIPVDTISPLDKPVVEKQWEYHWQRAVERLTEKYGHCHLFDMKQLVEQMGRNQFYSFKMWYSGNIPYSLEAIKKIEEKIECYSKTVFSARKKVLAVDLDNTLWGGVIGEEQWDGIELSEHKAGARFYDLQCRIKELKESGILLAIVSKNNEADVRAVWENPAGMVLKENDFVCKKINWKDKAENLLEIAEELNLGLDSFVFLDDNPVERELVRQRLPEVTVLDFPEDTAKLEQTILDAAKRYFSVFRLTGEDAKKTEVYQQEQKRHQLKQTACSFEEYIKTLNIWVNIEELKKEKLERAVQLCQKTNQFNVTTKRYTQAEMLGFMQEEATKVLVISAGDCYGEQGLVAVVILKEKKTEVYVDTFLMSCRVMGRYLEEIIMDEIVCAYKEKGFRKITALYEKTTKNKPVECFYEQQGFCLVSGSADKKQYELILAEDQRKRNKKELYENVIWQ